MLQLLKTQTQAYWQDEFAVSSRDLEFLYSLLIETGLPLKTDQMAQAIVEQRQDGEINQIRAVLKKGRPFQPQQTYEVGETVIFPTLDCALGTVTNKRPGHNPEYGSFSVTEVQFEGDTHTREFASDLKTPHKLNLGDSLEGIVSTLASVPADELFARYGSLVQQKLEASLATAENLDFVRFGQQWYLRGLLADVHVGHRNVVEAVLDVNGGPLAPEELLKQIDLPTEIRREAQFFSLNYALQHDERFDDVGTDDQVLWFLRRMEPPEAVLPPRRLLARPEPYNRAVLTEEMLRLERELDDDLAPVDPGLGDRLDAQTVSLILTYPHRRVGTIPLTPRTRQFFPKGSTQHTRITLIDGQTGNHIPGWVVHQHRYVYGLDEWFRKNNLLIGAYIALEKTHDPFKVMINYIPKRERREWIRVARWDGGRLHFEMRKQPCRCEYDELMVVGEDDVQTIDALWLRSEEDGSSMQDILHQVFPELAKLSPQGTVHAKTLYSAANIVRRCPPGPIFATLVEDPSFTPVGEGYWLYAGADS